MSDDANDGPFFVIGSDALLYIGIHGFDEDYGALCSLWMKPYLLEEVGDIPLEHWNNERTIAETVNLQMLLQLDDVTELMKEVSSIFQQMEYSARLADKNLESG